MRGGNDADVDPDGFVTADAFDEGVLQDAKEADLGVEGELADFVKEERAAVGALEPALARFGGAGESALFVAEELGVDELAGNGAAVDADEWATAAVAAVVDGAGDYFLAGARFAEQQHGGVGDADQVDALHDGGKADGVADNALLQVFAAKAALMDPSNQTKCPCPRGAISRLMIGAFLAKTSVATAHPVNVFMAVLAAQTPGRSWDTSKLSRPRAT